MSKQEEEDLTRGGSSDAVGRQDLPQPATGDSSTPVTKHRIWAMHCPFRKSGSPVLGTFGYTERGVIIVPIETWNRLCREIPALATTQFEVGGYE